MVRSHRNAKLTPGDHIHDAVVRDLTIDGLKNGREPTFLTNCLFSHVKLVGSIGDLIVDLDLERLLGDELERLFSFYEDVDWALDIREATFASLSIVAIPGDKVLFDPKRHCRVHLDRVRSKKKLPAGLEEEAELWLDSPWSSIVLVAGDRTKYGPAQRAEHAKLRKAGLAD